MSTRSIVEEYDFRSHQGENGQLFYDFNIPGLGRVRDFRSRLEGRVIVEQATSAGHIPTRDTSALTDSINELEIPESYPAGWMVCECDPTARKHYILRLPRGTVIRPGTYNVEFAIGAIDHAIQVNDLDPAEKDRLIAEFKSLEGVELESLNPDDQEGMSLEEVLADLSEYGVAVMVVRLGEAGDPSTHPLLS